MENERTSVINQTELVIADVSREDCGEYYCVAKDDESVITSIGTLAIRDGEHCILIRLLFTVYMTLLILTDSSVPLYMKKKFNFFGLRKINFQTLEIYL